MDARARRRAHQFFALLGSSNEGERENARRKLDALLRKHGKTWKSVKATLRAILNAGHRKGGRRTRLSD